MKKEPTAVLAAFTAEGKVTPQRFDWQDSSLAVEGVGRRWSKAGQRCFNVMAMGGRLFELRFEPETLCWFIARGPIPQLSA